MYLEPETLKSGRDFSSFIENCEQFLIQLKTPVKKSPDPELPYTRFYYHVRSKAYKENIESCNPIVRELAQPVQNPDRVQPLSKKPRIIHSMVLNGSNRVSKENQLSANRDPRPAKTLLSENSRNVSKVVLPAKRKFSEISGFDDIYFWVFQAPLWTILNQSEIFLPNFFNF